MERKRPPSRRAVDTASELAKNWRRLKAARGGGGMRAWGQRVGIGEATLTRIQEGSPGTQLDSLVSLAAAFDLEPWQLLVPDLDPDAPPRLREQAYSTLVEQIAHQLEGNRAQQLAVAALLGIGGVSDEDVERKMPITRRGR